jgi:hypothetical protein
VSSRNGDDVTGSDLEFGAVVHEDDLLTRDHVPDVRAWQLSVPTMGFTWSDHFQPG